MERKLLTERGRKLYKFRSIAVNAACPGQPSNPTVGFENYCATGSNNLFNDLENCDKLDALKLFNDFERYKRWSGTKDIQRHHLNEKLTINM